jgi:hypothetical protein
VVVAKESTALEINLKDFGVKKGQDYIVVNTANGNSNSLYFDFKAYDPLVFRNLDGLKMANVFNSVLNIFSK